VTTGRGASGEGVSTEDVGEAARAGVQTRLGAEEREAGSPLRFRDGTGSGSVELEPGSAAASASASESESSSCTAAGRWVEGGGDGVAEWWDSDWAAPTSCCQPLSGRAAGSISRSSQMAARTEWATNTGWQSCSSGRIQPAAGVAAALDGSPRWPSTWRNQSFA
jgi:hypothetical protein